MSLAHQIYDPCQVDPSWLEVWENIKEKHSYPLPESLLGAEFLNFICGYELSFNSRGIRSMIC